MIGFFGPAASAVTAAPATADQAAPVAVCAEPPDTPDATPENRDRFVALWSKRFADSAWLADFTKLDKVPADILAEGFHAMGKETQVWLESCLLDAMLAKTGEEPTAQKRASYLVGLHMIVFGKDQLAKMRDEFNDSITNDKAPAQQQPVAEDQTREALAQMSEELTSEPSLTTADQPKTDARAPKPTSTDDLSDQITPRLQALTSAPATQPEVSAPAAPPALTVVPTALKPNPLTKLPLVPLVLKAVNDVLQLVAQIQAKLFTLPVINLLAPAFYRICAQSPTMPLACSISLPVGIPVPADVTGDNIPDVTGNLGVFTNLKDVGAKFLVQRLSPGSGPLPAHVFAVYDTPFVKKRIEVGFDGRASTLGTTQAAKFTLENALKAIDGDIQISADVTSKAMGSTAALSFAVKDLVGGSAGVLPTEKNPMTGAIQFSPFPTDLQVGAHLVHTSARDQDTFTVESTTPSHVNAVIDQKNAYTQDGVEKTADRRFTAEVDKLPTKVSVDLLHQGKDKQHITYRASAPIDLVRASDTATPDASKPARYTASTYEVTGVPTEVDVDLLKSEKIDYKANGHVQGVAFGTETYDGDEKDPLAQRMSIKAHDVPSEIHVTNVTDEDKNMKVTYDADAELGSVELGMHTRGDKVTTDVAAKATGIPAKLSFTQTAKGVLDVSAPDGIDLIEGSLTQNGGKLYDKIPDGDHATVLKVNDQLGADFKLTGFSSAHFDGTASTAVGLGLNPGGQSFEAIADLKDDEAQLDVLARARISALPKKVDVTFDPKNGTATYDADSVIPELTASFEQRDTKMSASAKLTDLPKKIGLAWNTSGETPSVSYDADSRLGSIDLGYTEKPDGLVLHGTISNLPKYMKVSGLDPIVFDARTAADAEPGSSDIGQILFQYGTDGKFESPDTTDDHAYLNTDLKDSTHAELQYSGLSLLSVATTAGQLHATVKNSAPRLFRAFVTTPELTLTGFIDKVPAEITVTQVDNKVTYEASGPIDEIATNLFRKGGDKVAVQIKDVPKQIGLVFDGANAKLEWDAFAKTGLVSAEAHLTGATLHSDRDFDAGLTITGIPVAWDASWANGNVLFNAPGDGIGSIQAQVTNHGEADELEGDHLNASYDEASGELDASLRISKLHKVSFTKLAGETGGGFEAELNMGDQGDFRFGSQIDLKDTTQLKATGEFNHLPSAVKLRSEGGRITYTGDSNPTLTVSVEAGKAAALAATPVPPAVHGVSVRDGAAGPDGADKAVKAFLHLTGLPDKLDLNSPAGTYAVGGYHPSNDTLVVDAKLNKIAPQPLTLLLQQKVPTASPVDFTFGPFLTSTAGDGTHNLSLSYNATQTLGKLTAEATYGNTDDAKLEISQIPSSINVNAGFGANAKTVGIAMSQGIDDITASYKKAGDADFAASVHLGDVPSTVNLQIGRGTADDGTKNVSAPDFTFTASQPGLDIDAVAKAAIADPVDVKAAVALQIEDMGSTVTGQLDGTSLKIGSSPATHKFLLDAAGGVSTDVDLGFEAGPLTNTGSLGVNIDIRKLTLGFKDASELQLDLGVTTGIKGDYDNFTLGIDSDTHISLRDKLRLEIPTPFGDVDINIVNVPTTNIDLNNVIDHFRIASNRLATSWSQTVIDVLAGYCDFDIKFRPHAEGSTSGSSFSLGQPPSDGNPPAWLVTPDPNLLGFSVPDFVVDVVMYFTSPYGHDLGAGLSCHSRI
ncbi:MAG: hypothetical protein J7518_22890 [Nocardioidaceae bacterium]|nr:hypothetical protein [Nocardioidaceae bacterium]